MLSPGSPGEGRQPGSSVPLPAQLSSRAGPRAGTALPRLGWARAAPTGQRGTPGTTKQSGKVLYFLTVGKKIKGIFNITVHDIFLNIERDFSCYTKTPSSLLSKLTLYFLSQVFHCWFFSCLCLKFLQCGTNTKHAPGRKHTAKFCLSSAWLKAVSSAHLGVALIKTNSQMKLPNDFFSLGGSAEKDTRYTLQHCSQGSLSKQGEELIGSLLGRDKFAKIQKR